MPPRMSIKGQGMLVVGSSAERLCPVIVTDLRDTAVTGFTMTLPFDRNKNVIGGYTRTRSPRIKEELESEFA